MTIYFYIKSPLNVGGVQLNTTYYATVDDNVKLGTLLGGNAAFIVNTSLNGASNEPPLLIVIKYNYLILKYTFNYI